MPLLISSRMFCVPLHASNDPVPLNLEKAIQLFNPCSHMSMRERPSSSTKDGRVNTCLLLRHCLSGVDEYDDYRNKGVDFPQNNLVLGP